MFYHSSVSKIMFSLESQWQYLSHTWFRFPNTLHFQCFLCMHACRVWLCVPMDCSLSGSSVPGILQARVLEFVVMPCSRGSSRPRDRTHVSCGSCIAGWLFHCWATGEALCLYMFLQHFMFLAYQWVYTIEWP